MFSAVQALNASLLYFYCSSRSKSIFVLKPTIILHGYFLQRMLNKKFGFHHWNELQFHGAGIIAFTIDHYTVFYRYIL